MPQGPAYLHEFWEDDGNAWEFLKSQGYTETRSMIDVGERVPTFVEKKAIQYLIQEWDWDAE